MSSKSFMEKEIKSNLENNQYHPILSPAYNIYPNENANTNSNACDESRIRSLNFVEDEENLSFNENTDNQEINNISMKGLKIFVIIFMCILILIFCDIIYNTLSS